MTFDQLHRRLVRHLFRKHRPGERPLLRWSLNEDGIALTFASGATCTVDRRWPRVPVR